MPEPIDSREQARPATVAGEPAPLNPFPAVLDEAAPSRDTISQMSSDPFAGLPRLSPFIDDAPAGPANPPAAPEAVPSPVSQSPDSVQREAVPSSGWSSPTTVASDAQAGRRHAADEEQRQVPADAPPPAGRRRRADGETSDILSRLLGPS